MTDERPSGACLLHIPPNGGRHWVRADDGYRTCADCLDRLRAALHEIRDRYRCLSPRPGVHTDYRGRRAPGFGPRSPASDHVIAMLDWRSKPCETSWDGTAYVWDPLADSVLEPGQLGPPGGAYVDKYPAWYGADGRSHAEQSRPPRSVALSLAGLADLIAESRGVLPHRTPPRWPPTPPAMIVERLTSWIDQHLDYVTRQDWVPDIADDVHELAAQLRPATGEPGKAKIGDCPYFDLDTGKKCGAPLRAPTVGDTIRCSACGTSWPRPEWEHLGRLIQQERLADVAS